MKQQRAVKRAAVFFVSAFLVAAATSVLVVGASAQRKRSAASGAGGREVTILVTAHPHNDRTRAEAARLHPDDFAVREQKRAQRIISVKRATEAPPIVAVLIQDDLVTRVNTELKVIKEFIKQLPEGSRVMTGYLTIGDLSVTQEFTTDRQRAAESLRVVRGFESAAPFSPYLGLTRALKQFDSQPSGRRMVLMISDGLDTNSASPISSIYLERAIREAQRRGVAVFSFFAPAVGPTSTNRFASNFGQSSLSHIAEETGGEAFFTGRDFVTFDPYLKEFNEVLALQWLITYQSTTTGSEFRRVEVTTESDVHLHHAKGYRPRD